jgi:hypothetical protein
MKSHFSASARRARHDVTDQPRAGRRRFAGFLGRAGGAQNIFGGDVAMVARELVAAVRPADAAQDPVMHQRLQDRLEMARRQLVPRG